MGLFSRSRQRKPVRVAVPPPTGDPDLDRAELGSAYAEAMPPGDRPVTASEIPGIVARWRSAMAEGRELDVWDERLAYGYGVDLDAVGQPDRFWFNALPALAGLAVGYQPHPVVAMCAGNAESDRDRAQPDQVKAIADINAAYFGG